MKCVTVVGVPGLYPSCELSGTPSTAINCIGCGTPSKTYSRSTTESADELLTRQNSFTVACISMTAGTKLVEFGSVGEVMGTKLSDKSKFGMFPAAVGLPGTG